MGTQGPVRDELPAGCIYPLPPPLVLIRAVNDFSEYSLPITSWWWRRERPRMNHPWLLSSFQPAVIVSRGPGHVLPWSL